MVMEREMDLRGITAETPDVIISFNYALGDRTMARFLAATPENLIQAGRALADIAEGVATIQQRFLTAHRRGVLLKTLSDSGYSCNAVLKTGTSGSLSIFKVMRMGHDGEYLHPRFRNLMRYNLEQGFDPALTITKHVVIGLILEGFEPVFVDPNGEILDEHNCWQLVDLGMQWEYDWLQRRMAR